MRWRGPRETAGRAPPVYCAHGRILDDADMFPARSKAATAAPGPRHALAVALFLVLSGCASVEPLDDGYAAPPPVPAEIAARFCYRAAPIEEQRALEDENRRYRLYTLSIDAGLPQFDDDSPVTFEYYQQTSGERVPVIVVLPILNGRKHIVRPFASYFARHGYAVVIVDTVQRKTLLDDLSEPEPAILQAALRHRRVLDWIEAQPELDSERIGVFGASLGGFNALFLAAADERVRAVAPALVAGDLPFVLTRSNERRIREAVTKAQERLAFDQEAMRAYLEARIETDPLRLAPYMDASRVLMVLARFDKAVPYEKQLELREALGNPTSITLPSGHVTAAFYIFYLRSRILDFIDDRLSAPRPERIGSVVTAPDCDRDRLPAASSPAPGGEN